MARFYFHVRCGDLHFADEDGVFVADASVAEFEAVNLLAELAMAAVNSKQLQPVSIQLADDNGKPVFETSLNFKRL